MCFFFQFSAEILHSTDLKNGQFSSALNQPKQVYYEENKNQWPSQVLFKANVSGGVVFLESDRFTFSNYHAADLDKARPDEETGMVDSARLIRCHAWSVHFGNTLPTAIAEGQSKLNAYSNYFIGNDASKWAGFVRRFESVYYSGLYNGIDLHAKSEGSWFKYDFIVSAGADVSQINLTYEGIVPQLQPDGSLLLALSSGNVTEQRPVAWQVLNGLEIPVRCEYMLSGNVLRFAFPDGYNRQLPLIIDPVVVGATYSGSFAPLLAYSGTYDDQGNIYATGSCSSLGYPTTVGAYNTTFSGPNDIVITKFDTTASTQIYSTYIGGTSAEAVFSMIVSPAGELYIMGYSASANYPITPTAYDGTISGTWDIIITRFNATGSALLGSTFIGGSNVDGFDLLVGSFTARSEIILGPNGNVYVASNTRSVDFPVSPGAAQTVFGGQQDAVVFSMPPGLNSLLFSTYLGGTLTDGARSLRVNQTNGDIYVCGATSSSNFPVTPGAYQTVFTGGIDAYVTRLNSNATAIVASTYYGIPVCVEHFVHTELNAAGEVYLAGRVNLGLSSGTPITAGVYSNPNSSVLITKMDPTLGSVIFSTRIGNSTPNTAQLIMTAFMVDDCENIFIAGVGAFNYPTTPNALYPNNTAPSGGLYVAHLAPNATSLVYATQLTGAHSYGGMSRFSRSGVLYQSVAALNVFFQTTPGAYATTPNVNDDMCAVKFDLQVPPAAQARAETLLGDTGCAPFTVSFSNSSTGTSFSWDFGDGSPVINAFSPFHVYTTPGTYTVTLIASSILGCVVSDTLFLNITVLPEPSVNLGTDTALCGNSGNFLLDAANPGLTYNWSTGATTQTILPTAPGTYWVVADNGFCTDTDSILIAFTPAPLPINDTTLCAGQTQTLTATSGQSWLWNTGATTPGISVTQTGTYSVIVNDGACVFNDTAVVTFLPVPVVSLGADTVLCGSLGNFVLDAANPGLSYSWSTGATTQTIAPTAPGTYWVVVNNGSCTDADSILITFTPAPQPISDTTLCAGQTQTLTATSGQSWIWNTGATTPSISVTQTGNYSVIVNDGACVFNDTAVVTFLPVPVVNLGTDTVLCASLGNLVLDAANPGLSYSWSTGATTQTIAPTAPGTYWVVVNNGSCTNADSILITFTPAPQPISDTTLCVGQTQTLTATSGQSWLWSTGATTQSISVTQTGNYSVILTDGACVFNDTAVITFLQVPVVNLGADTLLCASLGNLVLDAANPGLTYNWSTGATTQTIAPAAPGTYWVVADNGSCTDSDSILITFTAAPPPISDITSCAGQTPTLTATSGQSWLWNTGATTQTITVNTGGIYSVAITDGSCIFQDTVFVAINPLPVVNLGNDTLLCQPGNYLLDAGNSGANWNWNTGAVSQQIQVNTAGSYAVSVTALNCTGSDTIEIAFATPPELGNSATLCTVQELTLTPGSYDPGTNFSWNTGATTPSITVNQAGTYSVIIQFEQCVLTDSVEVTGNPGEGIIYIPNTFTPNRDGLNEVFLVAGNDIVDFHMKIFNRWGQLIFESYDINAGWNGTYNNTPVQQDTYVVVTRYRTACNSNSFEQRITHVNVIK